MRRFLIAIVLALAPFSSALAQDMPLSQILIDGEGWKKVENSLRARFWGRFLQPVDPTVLLWHKYTADFSTEYASPLSSRALVAIALDKDRKPIGSAPYCPLRVKPGAKGTVVMGIALDRDGRIYAATDLGIQVFDPTGRLCGVMTAPPGFAEFFHFEDDRLVLWIDETKYTRKLNTLGKK